MVESGLTETLMAIGVVSERHAQFSRVSANCNAVAKFQPQDLKFLCPSLTGSSAAPCSTSS